MSTTHVIIVNYNAGDWLLRCVSSVLNTDVTKVTVVDNNSSDHSIRQTQQAISDDRLTFIENEENRGFAAANNQVLASLDSDFAVLLNPDCELPQATLPALMRTFERRPQLGLASCRIEDEQGHVHKTSRRRFPTPWSALVRMLKLQSLQPSNPRFADFDLGSDADSNIEFEMVEAISGAFMVVRRDALQQVGLLDEGYFMHCEDLDWCKRFEQAGWNVGYIGSVRVIHAKGVSSNSRPIGVLWNLHRGMARFFGKFYRDETNIFLRGLVQLGIYSSFFLRAIGSILRRGHA